MAKRQRKNKVILPKEEVKKEEKKFPQNFRSIPAIEMPSLSLSTFLKKAIDTPPDLIFWRLVIPLGLIIILLINVQIFVSQTYIKYIEAQNQQKKVLGVKTEISHWEEVLKTIPDYRDGNIQLALLYYQVGNFGKAKEFAQKAYDLDPNYAFNETLQGLIEKK